MRIAYCFSRIFKKKNLFGFHQATQGNCYASCMLLNINVLNIFFPRRIGSRRTRSNYPDNIASMNPSFWITAIAQPFHSETRVVYLVKHKMYPSVQKETRNSASYELRVDEIVTPVNKVLMPFKQADSSRRVTDLLQFPTTPRMRTSDCM